MLQTPIDIIATSLRAPSLDDNRRSCRSVRRAPILVPNMTVKQHSPSDSYPQILWITVCKTASH